MKTEDVIFKGTRRGLWIILPYDDDFVRLKGKLAERLESTGGFFAGATRAILDIGELTLAEDETRELVSIIESFGISVSRVAEGIAGAAMTTDGTDERSAKRVTAPRRASVTATPRIQVETPEASEGETFLVRRTLRSGQRITYGGNVVVLGDINPGAEVVAGGDIVIVGSLRGVAHAGTPANRGALVVALRFMPTQLRIADVIARSPDGEHRTPRNPEMARIKDDKIVIEAYSGRRAEFEEELT